MMLENETHQIEKDACMQMKLMYPGSYAWPMRSDHMSRGPAVRLGYVTEKCIAREGLGRRFAGTA